MNHPKPIPKDIYPKWVMCVNDSYAKDYLTIGKIYKCVGGRPSRSGIIYQIKSPDDKVTWDFLSVRFIDIPQGDIQKNERISVNENQNDIYPKWVMCVDNSGYKIWFTVGKIYKCVGKFTHSSGDVFYKVINNDNKITFLRAKRFIDIPQGNIQKNERISVNESNNTFPKWVMCVDDKECESLISIGKIYKCVGGYISSWTNRTIYQIQSPNGKETWKFLSKRFIDIPQGDIQKNESLNNDTYPPRGDQDLYKKKAKNIR